MPPRFEARAARLCKGSLLALAAVYASAGRGAGPEAATREAAWAWLLPTLLLR